MMKNTMVILGLIVSLVTPGLTIAASKNKKEEEPRSGYLAPETYGKLEKVEIRKDVHAERWQGPRLSTANYKSMIIDDVVLYPEPEPGPQVSAETLQAISTYLTKALHTRMAEVLTVVTEPGPGVIRMQPAVTGVEIKTEGMKGYEVVPVAAIFGGLKAMTGKRDRDVHVFVEARLVDSETGEVLGAAVRKLSGKQLKGKKDQLELEDMEESLDGAAGDAEAVLADVFKE